MHWALFVRDFVLVLALSFLIGLEREEVHHRQKISGEDRSLYFGGIRTFPLIGVLGMVLYLINPQFLSPYVVGLVSLSGFLALHYWSKLQRNQGGITTEIAALITYALGPMVVEKPIWWPVGLTVATVLLLHSKPTLHYFTRTVPRDELLTVSKFLILIGVVLPLLPKQKLPFLEISPYQIWLAVVAVSSISYASYLIQTYLFRERGLLLSGFLGGIYSSTATTVVFARRVCGPEAVSPIVVATGAMYLRLTALIFLFNMSLALALLPPFLVAAAVAAVVAFILQRMVRNYPTTTLLEKPKNPLELTTAFVFAFLFVAVVSLTRWALTRYGQHGLQVLAGIIGFVDIDPFILGIVQGKYQAVDPEALKQAVVLASISNNFAKGLYALLFGRLKVGGPVLLALGLISAALWFSLRLF